MRSTLKCDIIVSLNIGLYFMKTKIIYISGNEIFDMADIRAAFDEVRNALNLDKNTVLFGVPIDEDDAGLAAQTEHEQTIEDKKETINQIPEITENSEPLPEPEIIESVDEKPKRSRGKRAKAEPDDEPKDVSEAPVSTNTEEKIVPILSVLSTNESVVEDSEGTSETTIESNENIEIIADVTNETSIVTEPETEIESDTTEPDDTEEPDLEKLLSEMKPLNEDIMDEQNSDNSVIENDDENDNIDATLEKLATEFVQTQDKIASNTKSGGRSKIGKLRNILPFKQSKHHDQGLGDLFGWAGVAANDEDFSVPGFFTNASSKK